MCIHSASLFEEACEICTPHATRQTFNPYTREPTRRNEEPMNDNKQFPIPAEVSAALTTGRRSLLGMLENAVISGDRLISKEEIVGILHVLGDYMEAHHRDLMVMTKLLDDAKVMDDTAKGLMGLAEQVRESVRMVRSE